MSSATPFPRRERLRFRGTAGVALARLDLAAVQEPIAGIALAAARETLR